LTRGHLRAVDSLPRRPRHDPLLWFLLGLMIACDLASVASLLLLIFSR
jgi:hypothetical protein